jgi:hypothetical protein
MGVCPSLKRDVVRSCQGGRGTEGLAATKRKVLSQGYSADSMLCRAEEQLSTKEHLSMAGRQRPERRKVQEGGTSLLRKHHLTIRGYETVRLGSRSIGRCRGPARPANSHIDPLAKLLTNFSESATGQSAAITCPRCRFIGHLASDNL